MSLSLRDQLLQAGFVASKPAKQAEQQKQRQQPKAKRPAADRPQQQQRPVDAAKLARDRELNRQRQEQREHGARLAAIRQIVEQNRLPPLQSEDYFNFVHKNKVRRIAVDAALRERIVRGEVFIVRYGKFYALVSSEIAARVRERHAASVVVLAAAQDAPVAEDDPYKDFAVPDDLMW